MAAKISVVITTTAYTPYMHRLLSSLNEQTLTEIEIIVVSSIQSQALEFDIHSFTKKLCRLKYVKNRTPYISMVLNGIAEATGEYIVFCSESLIFESGTLEELYRQAQTNESDIIQYKIHFTPENGVTHFLANTISRQYVLYNQKLSANALMKKSCLEHSVSMQLEGKMFRRNILEKAAQDIKRFGCSYEEVLWFYAMSHCSTYLGVNSRQYAMRIVRVQECLSLDQTGLDRVIEQKKILDEIGLFLSASGTKIVSDEEKEKILQSLHLDLLKNVITMWGSNRCPETLCSYGIRKINQVWGSRDMICGLASWAKSNREMYVRYLADLFTSTHKNKYDCAAVFNNEWIPFEESIGNRKLIRFSASEKNTNDKTDQENIIILPAPKGILWYQMRFDAIQLAIQNHHIDLFCFKNCEIGSFWDILTVKSCGAHVVIDDREAAALLPLVRQNNTNLYLNYLLPMLHADAVMISEDADITNFKSMGINYTYEETMDAVLKVSNQPLEKSENQDICLSEEKLLRKQYYELLNSYTSKLNQFRRVIGPYETSLFWGVRPSKIQKAIRRIIWKEKFIHESLIGKCKLLVKTVFKIAGVRNISLGLQNYRLPPKISFKTRTKKMISHFHLLFHPKQLVNKIQQQRKRSLACEKRMSFGKKKKKKTFYLIRLNPGNEGLLLSYLHVLRELENFNKSNLIPVIDMQWEYYTMAHNSQKNRGKVNGWEMYFKPVGGYSLKEAYRSKNVIRGHISYRNQADNYFRTNILKSNTPEAEKKFKKWCHIDQKYMGLKEELRSAFEEEYAHIIGGKRTIGIMVREGYSILNKLNYALITNHAVQPELDAVVEDLKVLLEEWNCEQIFVSAEYDHTIRVFQEAFGDKVVYTQRKRKDFVAAEAEEYRTKRTEYYSTISREEINRDYLKEVYLLSKCTCLLAGRASASIVAALWNNGQYEHRKIYDLGTYSVDTTKRVVSLNEKQ